MKTRSIILLVTMLFVVVLAVCSCEFLNMHTWSEATCTTPKTCTICGATEGDPLGHVEEVLEGKDATCIETGLTEGKKCSVCDVILVEQEVIPTVAHTEEAVAGKDATCSEKGYTAGKKCSVCDTVLEGLEEIPMIAHTEVIDAAKAPTCTETGLTEGKHCSVCGEVLVAQNTVDALGHTEVTDAAKAATCTESGLTEGKHCSVCNEVLVAQNNIDALGHTEETVPGKAATCEETGLTDGKKCSICGETLTAQEEIAALGHAYGEAIYSWSADNSTCTATKTCGNDASHLITESATVITVKLTVTAEKVTYTYNVEFANSDFAAQSKTVDGEMAVANKIATVNAPAIAGRVASHDYVMFGLHNAEETHEFTIYYSEVDLWDGTSVSTGLAGSGTAEDPYLIQSGADLAYLKSAVDAAESYTENIFAGVYFKMTKSIDLGGRHFMIGYHTAWNKYDGFAGIFDGNNCTIRGLNIKPESGTAALFACVKKGGEVKNLSLYGQVSGTANVASAVGYLLGTIDNITNYAAINGTSTLGGVVANAENNHNMDKNKLYISECFVCPGPILKRIRPKDHGRAHRIEKRTSHVTMVLREKNS